MVGIGNIVSVGGGGGGSGGGGTTSGIQIFNGQVGPTVTLVGTSGIVVAPIAPNIINIGFNGSTTQSGVVGVNGINVNQIAGEFLVDGAALSGLIVPSGGIGSINGQIGPVIEIEGVNGIQVSVSAENSILINGAGASGVGGTVSKFAASFTNITSGIFTHSFGTLDVIVQIFNIGRRVVLPDNIVVENANQVSVVFNRPQSGRVVII